MNTKKITVVKDFYPKPYGRYNTDCPTCDKSSGEAFRKKILAPAMNQYDKVIVDLSGYNRYGRSFLDEAFGGLIREEGFTLEQVKSKISLNHDILPTIVDLINERLASAEDERKNKSW